MLWLWQPSQLVTHLLCWPTVGFPFPPRLWGDKSSGCAILLPKNIHWIKEVVPKLYANRNSVGGRVHIKPMNARAFFQIRKYPILKTHLMIVLLVVCCLIMCSLNFVKVFACKRGPQTYFFDNFMQKHDKKQRTQGDSPYRRGWREWLMVFSGLKGVGLPDSGKNCCLRGFSCTWQGGHWDGRGYLSRQGNGLDFPFLQFERKKKVCLHQSRYTSLLNIFNFIHPPYLFFCYSHYLLFLPNKKAFLIMLIRQVQSIVDCAPSLCYGMKQTQHTI